MYLMFMPPFLRASVSVWPNRPNSMTSTLWPVFQASRLRLQLPGPKKGLKIQINKWTYVKQKEVIPGKINMSLEKEPISKEISSSNYKFSGGMLVCRGVRYYSWGPQILLPLAFEQELLLYTVIWVLDKCTHHMACPTFDNSGNKM